MPRATTMPARTAGRRLPATKVSLSVDHAVMRDVRTAARRAGRNVSAYVTEALARDIRRRNLAEFIAEYEAKAGVITEAELASARAKWRA